MTNCFGLTCSQVPLCFISDHSNGKGNSMWWRIGLKSDKCWSQFDKCVIEQLQRPKFGNRDNKLIQLIIITTTKQYQPYNKMTPPVKCIFYSIVLLVFVLTYCYFSHFKQQTFERFCGVDNETTFWFNETTVKTNFL